MFSEYTDGDPIADTKAPDGARREPLGATAASA